MQDWVIYLPLVAGLLAAGALAGITAGLLGVGGGIVMVPAMALAFEALGYDPAVYQHVAVGTSLAVIISTGFASARAHHAKGAVMMDLVRLWAVPLIAASLAGGLMAGLYSGDVLRLVFGGVAILLAANSVLSLQQKLMGHLRESPVTHRICAAVIGYVSALMGIGGGSLSVPTLNAFGHSMHKAVGTSAAFGLLLAIPGAIGFVVSGWAVADRAPLSLGYVNIPALLLIGVVASFTAPLGAALAHKTQQHVLKRIFAVYLLFIGSRMIFQAVTG